MIKHKCKTKLFVLIHLFFMTLKFLSKFFVLEKLKFKIVYNLLKNLNTYCKKLTCQVQIQEIIVNIICVWVIITYHLSILFLIQQDAIDTNKWISIK